METDKTTLSAQAIVRYIY